MLYCNAVQLKHTTNARSLASLSKRTAKRGKSENLSVWKGRNKA